MQTIKLMATTLFIGGSLAIGCTPDNNTTEPQATTPVSVKVNQSTRIGQDITVQVTNIQDSRCPANAVCIRYGSANVDFTLQKDGSQQMGSLCLGECGQGLTSADTTTVQLSGITYRVVLSEVHPYPGTGTSDTNPEAVIQLLR